MTGANRSPQPPVRPSGLLDLETDEQRRLFFSRQPELRQPSTVEALCEEVARMVRVDLERAESFAATALWLADDLEDDTSRARSWRALANTRFFQRRYQEASAHYEKALRLFEKRGRALEAAITRSTAIACLGHLGKTDDALRWAAKAREILELHGDRLRLARLEANVAVVLVRLDRFREAMRHYQASYEILLEAGTPLDVGIALRNIAVCYQDLNDFPSSLDTYERARRHCRKHDLPLLGLEVEYNIAYLHFLRGRYTQAIRLFDRARRTCEKLEDHHHKALCDLDQSEIFLELNLTDDARRLARQAYDGFQRLGMPYESAKALTYLAIAAQRLERPEAALELLEKARRIFEQQRNPVWTALIDLHRCRILSGEQRIDEASALAGEALRVFSEAGLPTKTAMCQILLARLELQRYRPEPAVERCSAALEILAGVGMPALEYQARLVRGQAQELSGRQEEAVADYLGAHRALEDLRSHLRSEELKIAFLEDKLAVYEGLVTLTLSGERAEDSARTAFEWIEKAKSRSLVDLLSLGGRGLPGAGGRAGVAREIQRQREDLNWYYRQIDEAEIRGGAHARARIEKLRRQVRVRERHIQATLREHLTDDREFRSLQVGLTADLESVRSALPDGALLVEYYIARERIWACLLDRQSLDIVPVSSAARVREQHQLLQLQLSKFRLGPEYIDRYRAVLLSSTAGALSRLHDELVAPFADRLPETRLIVVPHGFLHHLPFHAFFDGERHLLERCPVTYAQSATVLQLCATREIEPRERALVMGVPDARAPSIEQEVQAVAAALPDSDLFLGPAATRSVLSELGPRARYVHLATHGLFRQDNPMFSAIQLGDARLSLFDLYGLELQAELAVLSGCATGLSAVRGGDDLVGLTRGLLYAGARSVLVSLWDVQDESTARFMELFYRQLTEGSRPAAALRGATLELRRSHPHPYHWAPFILVGRG